VQTMTVSLRTLLSYKSLNSKTITLYI